MGKKLLGYIQNTQIDMHAHARAHRALKHPCCCKHIDYIDTHKQIGIYVSLSTFVNTRSTRALHIHSLLRFIELYYYTLQTRGQNKIKTNFDILDCEYFTSTIPLVQEIAK